MNESPLTGYETAAPWSADLAPKPAPVVHCACGASLVYANGYWGHIGPPHGAAHLADPKPRDLARWRKWRDDR